MNDITTTYQPEEPNHNQLATLRNLRDIVAEYDEKTAAIPQVIAAFESAGTTLKSAACVAGAWGNQSIETGRVSDWQIKESLLTSAWRHVYDGLNIASIASAVDKKRFEQSFADPAPFTLDNIRATFGDYLLNPRQNILRGLAEVFGDLDPAFKSHDKMKIGVSGLPKRVIISRMNSFYDYGKDQLRDVLNALAALQRKPMVSYEEAQALLKDENALLHEWQTVNHKNQPICYPARGVRLRRFANGNGHLFFEPDTLRDVNLALAEYYGDVLADCSEEKPGKQRPGTAISKDLQYYPTPAAVVDRILTGLIIRQSDRVLEPSCGCGRFLDALKKTGAEVMGVEYDQGRAMEAKAKGHSVLIANFLETVPNPIYSHVIMNPPFYGKHYAKHVEHAFKFLKPGGSLTAILPITARYDHGLLDGRWQDLPVGSFSESGTNINTTVLTMHKPRG